MGESVEPGQGVDGEQEGGQVAAVDQEFKIHVQASHREVDIVCEKEKKWAGLIIFPVRRCKVCSFPRPFASGSIVCTGTRHATDQSRNQCLSAMGFFITWKCTVCGVWRVPGAPFQTTGDKRCFLETCSFGDTGKVKKGCLMGSWTAPCCLGPSPLSPLGFGKSFGFTKIVKCRCAATVRE